ncbi:hypothetical protein [Campylobacter lari]|uniref:hypothetical protein n=1 Tax=Campylobacter lari TaxID=201 RepID=UPI00214A8703|nr:hypothetical protein [Campylobacter lari]MCR2075886.1 hypothetical protein [Campylobacter lari subsp. concheus]MCR2084053.1 hypothetical protein [Campylobacter lari subsp. concheus]MCR2085678.1 hypothetical protein [Campylobacter lari subsp. concheus]MCV3397867.1 hypothetical protein [Campylobacter lari]
MRAKNFRTFFFLYGRYLQYDLIHSLEQEIGIGRNVDLLIHFREFFKMIISSDIQEQEAKEGFKNLKTDIENYIGDKKQECLDIQLDKIRHSTFNYDLLLEKDFKDLLSDFCVSCGDFKFIDNIESKNSQEFEKDKHGRSVLVQSLLEFNNALSHIFISVYHGNDKLKNIEKAKNHLYRGTIDNYKMFIRISFELLKKNTELFQKFKNIRIEELLQLGKDIHHKKIEDYYLHLEYKELYNECVFMFKEDQSNSQTQH